jgi:hypothetical protein
VSHKNLSASARDKKTLARSLHSLEPAEITEKELNRKGSKDAKFCLNRVPAWKNRPPSVQAKMSALKKSLSAVMWSELDKTIYSPE